ncbi:MAG: hypothetical protein HYR91_09190 [Flavobacteriia bacterium]|nr:hypothetical protein [Flavobacteriia bacterium]
MKKNYIILSALLIAVGALSFQHSGNEEIKGYLKQKHYYPDGSGMGNVSGAPTDGNCTGCHSGTAQSGASKNTLTVTSGLTPITSYVPGTTYNVALTMNPNPTKKGFEAVVMTSTNAIAGSIATITGGGVTITNSRAHHNSTSNTSSNSAWIWSWTAPSTNVGDVTFYVSSMVANGTGNQSGDVVYLSQHVIPASSAGVIEQVQNSNKFSAGYSADQNAVVMDFSSLVAGNMFFNLVDMSGRSVFTYKMGQSQIGANHEKIVLPEDLKNGIYVVNMFVNNKAMEQKIMIQK